MRTALLPDPASVETMTPDSGTTGEVPTHVAKRLIGGTSALGASIFLERGAGFLANILAARLGGASTFGAYSLAITTANNISTYAAGGIGSTAARFSGKYPQGTPGYKTLGRVLVVVSLASGLLASIALWFGAAPIAHLLQKESLTGLLRWAALSAAGIILLECARGFFVGQRRHAALMLLSLFVGVGMMSFIPYMATQHNPVHMIVSQGMITMSAVVVCLIFAKPLGLLATGTAKMSAFGPILKEVWAFGFIQLAGLIGANLAGWWLTTLVARADTTLVQMSFLAIANQLRNIVALAPSQLTESSYAIMADPSGETSNTPSHIMALCTYATTFASLLLASLGIVLMPWGLHLLYGGAYKSAVATATVALAVAVIHMGNAPAAARLSIVSIKAAGVINTVWAIFVAVTATVFLLHHGSAQAAMTIYLVGHLLSSALVLMMLYKKDFIPSGMVTIFSLGSVSGICLAALALLRDWYPANALFITGLMSLLAFGSLAVLFVLGRKHRWLPDPAVLRRLPGSALESIAGLFSRSKERRSNDA